MPLTPRQVEAFRAVMLTGTVSQAARSLHVTQSAISRLIKELEEALPFRIFDRRQGRLHATAEAAEVLTEVERHYVGLAELARAIQRIGARKGVHLRVVGMPAVALSLLPCVMRRFREAWPASGFTLHVDSSPSVVHQVASGQYDVGVAALPADHPALSVETMTARCVCVLPAGHPLADEDGMLTPERLAAESLVGLGEHSALHGHTQEAFRARGVTPTVPFEAPWSATACRLVLEGLGVSIVDPYTAAEFEERGISVKAFDPMVALQIGILQRRHGGKPDAPMGDFVALLRDALQAGDARYTVSDG